MGFHGDAEGVVDGQVAFLNQRGAVKGDFDADVAERRHFPATAAGETEGAHSAGAGDPQGVEDVGGVARRADAHQHVAGSSVGVDLLGEHQLRCDVVGEGGCERGVSGERHGGQAALQVVGDKPAVCAVILDQGGSGFVGQGTLEHESFHQLADDVVGVRRAAAVAAGVEGVVRGEGGDQHFVSCLHIGQDRLQVRIGLAEGLDGFVHGKGGRLLERVQGGGDGSVAADGVAELGGGNATGGPRWGK